MSVLCKLGAHVPEAREFYLDGIESHTMQEIVCSRCGKFLEFRTQYVSGYVSQGQEPRVHV